QSSGIRWDVAVICVALQLVLTGLPASGLVLCRAADGHMALEIAHQGSCLADYHRHHPTDAPQDFDEHGCSDTVLSSTPVSVQRIGTAAAVHPPLLVSLSPLFSIRPAYGFVPASPIAQAPHSSTPLRTIVLLI